MFRFVHKVRPQRCSCLKPQKVLHIPHQGKYKHVSSLPGVPYQALILTARLHTLRIQALRLTVLPTSHLALKLNVAYITSVLSHNSY